MRVLLGMSGGVDSTVSAILLKDKGYEVEGLFIKFFGKGLSDIVLKRQEDSLKRVEEVGKILDLNINVVDVSELFEKEVVSSFIDFYKSGKTPFPCAICNPKVKWKTLNDFAVQNNFDRIATGHYVSIFAKNGFLYIEEAGDQIKDQSFFLWGLDQEVLQKTIFPLAEITKDEVKKIAVDRGFAFYRSVNESVGVCFLEDANYRNFLRDRIGRNNPGKFLNENGEFLAFHDGVPFYTVGQRRGLKIKTNTSVYVKEIDSIKNEIVLAEKDSLFKDKFIVQGLQYVNKQDFSSKLDVKIRYRKQLDSCEVRFIDSNSAEIILDKPLDMIAPGQTAVFYKGNCVVGGGWIG